MDKREWKILNPDNRKEPIVVIPKAAAEEREKWLLEFIRDVSPADLPEGLRLRRLQILKELGYE